MGGICIKFISICKEEQMEAKEELNELGKIKYAQKN